MYILRNYITFQKWCMHVGLKYIHETNTMFLYKSLQKKFLQMLPAALQQYQFRNWLHIVLSKLY